MFPHVSTQLLYYYVVLAEEGSQARAAVRLHTTHSSVSRKLNLLRRQLGIEVLRRTARGLKPTQAGRVYAAEIRMALEYLARGFDRARYLDRSQRGPFRVGYSPYIPTDLLPFLEGLTLPGTDAPGIKLQTAFSMQLVRKVLHGQMQAGFGIMPIADSELWVHEVAREPFSICLPEKHPLAQQIRLSVQQLTRQTLYWSPRNIHPAFYDHITGYLQGTGVDLQYFREVRSVAHVMDFVARGKGMALVPRSFERLQCPGILFKPLTDELMRIETAFFVRRDMLHEEPVQGFVASVLAQMEKGKKKKAE